jgi:hypothetical protein
MFDYEKVENRKQYEKNMGPVYIHFCSMQYNTYLGDLILAITGFL